MKKNGVFILGIILVTCFLVVTVKAALNEGNGSSKSDIAVVNTRINHFVKGLSETEVLTSESGVASENTPNNFEPEDSSLVGVHTDVSLLDTNTIEYTKDNLDTASVPEPATTWLFGIGMAGIVVMVGKRIKQNDQGFRV